MKGSLYTSARAIGADQVWAGANGVPGYTGTGTTVAVVDSGINDSGDLAGKVTHHLDFTGMTGTGYVYSRVLTIDRTKVGVAGTTQKTLANFPLLVNITDAALKTTANGGHVTNSSGFDIIFKDTSGVKLDHEIETYNGSDGKLIAWVRIPVLNSRAAASDTQVFMYYGNSGITASTENVSV